MPQHPFLWNAEADEGHARRYKRGEMEVKLQRAGLIHYQRGSITVLDRPGLEPRCCECYQVVKTEFDRLLPYVAR